MSVSVNKEGIKWREQIPLWIIAPSFKKSKWSPAPKSYFNQDRDINSFEIQTIMIPGNETKLSGVSGLEIDGSHPERG